MARSGRWSYWPVLAVLVIGFAVTAVLVVVSHSVYSHNEKRLLGLRAKEAASLITASLPGIQTPLASAAALADATRGNRRKFRAFIAPYVGQGPQRPFVSVSLWKLSHLATGPTTVVGSRPELSRARVGAFLAASAHTPLLSVIGLLNASRKRIGYAFSTPLNGRYVAYAESALPTNRRAAIQANTAFSDLGFALYFGRTQRSQDLLVATVGRLPLPAPRAAEVVPFGNGTFTLALSARRPLSGSLPQRLPSIIALAGLVLTLVAAALISRLVQRRQRAELLAEELERVAAENRWLYAEQRNIASTLQHALLPESLPTVPGIEAAARYVAGEAGMEIGGDWYDVIPIAARSVLIAVGDVSGRGLGAASTMAALRFAIHAYAVQRDPPAVILSKLSRLLSIAETGQLATVLCATLDLDRRQITVASAGHLPPLLVANGDAEYLRGEVGVPIGVEEDSDYKATTVPVSEGSTLLAFTDGLVERRHETIDEGLARLREVASAGDGALPELLDHVLRGLADPPGQDDTAIVGVRWAS